MARFSVAAAFDFRLHVCCLEKKLNATHVSADKHSLAHSAATVAVVSLIWSPYWKPCTPVANCSILSQPGAVAVPVMEGAVVTTPPGAELPFAEHTLVDVSNRQPACVHLPYWPEPLMLAHWTPAVGLVVASWLNVAPGQPPMFRV